MHESLYDAFVEKAVVWVNALKLGNPLEADTDIGPMANVRFAAEVRAQIDTLVNQHTIRQVTCFSELRSQIDADAGWSPEVDALPREDWAAVQWRVTDILRTG